MQFDVEAVYNELEGKTTIDERLELADMIDEKAGRLRKDACDDQERRAIRNFSVNKVIEHRGHAREIGAILADAAAIAAFIETGKTTEAE
jgi:hypothetical protein